MFLICSPFFNIIIYLFPYRSDMSFLLNIQYFTFYTTFVNTLIVIGPHYTKIISLENMAYGLPS